PCPARQVQRAQTESARGRFDLALDGRCRQGRRVMRDVPDRDFGLSLPGNGRNALLDGGAQCGQLLLGKVPQLYRMLHQSGYHIAGVRIHLEMSYGPHLSPRHARYLLLDRLDDLCGSEQGVTPLGHWRRAGMICEAADFDLVLVDADDSVHDTDRNARLVQQAALLDMQLEITMDGPGRAARFLQPVRVAPNAAQAIGNAHAVAFPVEYGGRQATDHRQTADGSALLVGPDRDFERVARGDALFVQSSNDLQGRQGAQIP